MAEIELNVMTRQCLSRRIVTIDKLKSELSAWKQNVIRIQLNYSGILNRRCQRKTNITISSDSICHFLIEATDMINTNDTVH